MANDSSQKDSKRLMSLPPFIGFNTSSKFFIFPCFHYQFKFPSNIIEHFKPVAYKLISHLHFLTQSISLHTCEVLIFGVISYSKNYMGITKFG